MNENKSREEAVNTNPLNERQIQFAENYLQTRNGVRSYAEAYGYDFYDKEQHKNHYSSWSVASSNLLKDSRLQNYINEKMKQLDYQRELTDKEIIHELNKIALGGSVYKENTRMDALKTLMEYYGMFGDSTASQAININLGQDLKEAINEQTKDKE